MWGDESVESVEKGDGRDFEHTDELGDWEWPRLRPMRVIDPPISVIFRPYQKHFQYKAARHAISRRYKPTQIRTLTSSLFLSAVLVSGSR
jgi:hypothetical protein